ASRPPRFYFSFRSPYSWLAARVIGGPGTDRHGISYIPFWEPDEITLRDLRALGGEFLYTPMTKAKHLYILEDIRRLATSAGVRFFVHRREKFWGVDRIDAFLRGLGEDRERDGGSDVARRQSPAPVSAVDQAGCADVDHAGGCG